ncbi:aspartic proteinase nepenthesin-1-like [Phragmites australis]|uniref:aspartic proteinase nepenthesin-1-like n=1 Tax=Phragmites australis TaxID=29695 RepID=UPI002D7A0B30|nr:aspartic proteinase nepenthesin-1-like [Phragmites australis]
MQQRLVVLVLVVASVYASLAASAFVGDVRVELKHVDAGKQLSKPEFIRRAMQRSKARAAALSVVRNGGGARFSGESGQQQPGGIPVRPSGGHEYVLDLAIGTPPQPISALLDTGSDLIWTQCAPCANCLAQPDPLFAPGDSASYEPMRCSGQLCSDILHHSCQQPDTCTYQYAYGDGTMTMGVYATELFTFTSSSGDKLNVPLGFGCGSMNVGSLNNGSGIVGFGRDPLSLVSQLSIRRFSYCLTPYTSGRKSTLLFGSLSDGVYGDATGPVQNTPLLQSPQNPTFYYVHLIGLTVGSRRLRIPESAFALRPDGSGGVIVDSGTAFTLLPRAVFAEVVRAFWMQLRLPFANGSNPDDGVCFLVPAARRRASSQVPVPRMVFHFQGADLDLPWRNYVLDDHRKGRLCFILADSGEDSSTTIGNLVQQDMRVLYDLEAETLSFAPAQC